MNEVDEILFIFSRIFKDRYEGLDLDSSLFRLEEIMSSNKLNISYRYLVIDNALEIAKKDLEFYTRIMNWTVKNSTICLSYLFMKSTLQLINKKYNGKLGILLSNNNRTWTQLLFNCIRIIIQNELIEEVDISLSNTVLNGNIFIGKDSKSIIPITCLGKCKVQILDLLNDKYIETLVYSERELNTNDLFISISKLNQVYQYYNMFNVCDVTKMVYSQDNVEQYLLETNLKPNRYDELLFEKHGYLLFPLITDVTAKGGKLSIFNDGYGSLDDCIFCTNYSGKLIFNQKIEIKNNDSFDICIEDSYIREILNINSNDKIDFCFLFQKFKQTYRFHVSKEAWKVKEGLSKIGDRTMNINLYNNGGNMALGDHASVLHSTAAQINLDNKQMQELISKLSIVVANVEKLDVESNEKKQIRSKFEQALDATKKVNSDVSLIRNLIQESGILYKNVSTIPVLVEAVSFFKTLFGI